MALVEPVGPEASTSTYDGRLQARFDVWTPPPLESGDPALEINPDLRHVEFQIEDFIKNNTNKAVQLRLDTDSQICRANLQPGGCTKGSECPYRHVRPSPKNFRPPSPVPNSAHARTVCKHWLRGLCKKGAACEFLHEYNLRKMPECWFFAKYGYCASGDECMYLHVGPFEKRPECKGFTRGFCRLGPTCPKKHIRRVACPLYLSGFCPRGNKCPHIHPPFQLDDVTRIVEAASRADKDLYANRDWDWPQEQGGQGRFNPQNPAQPNAPAGRGRVRDMSNVTCHKCAQRGHLANQIRLTFPMVSLSSLSLTSVSLQECLRARCPGRRGAWSRRADPDARGRWGVPLSVVECSRDTALSLLIGGQHHRNDERRPGT